MTLIVIIHRGGSVPLTGFRPAGSFPSRQRVSVQPAAVLPADFRPAGGSLRGVSVPPAGFRPANGFPSRQRFLIPPEGYRPTSSFPSHQRLSVPPAAFRLTGVFLFRQQVSILPANFRPAGGFPFHQRVSVPLAGFCSAGGCPSRRRVSVPSAGNRPTSGFSSQRRVFVPPAVFRPASGFPSRQWYSVPSAGFRPSSGFPSRQRFPVPPAAVLPAVVPGLLLCQGLFGVRGTLILERYTVLRVLKCRGLYCVGSASVPDRDIMSGRYCAGGSRGRREAADHHVGSDIRREPYAPVGVEGHGRPPERSSRGGDGGSRRGDELRVARHEGVDERPQFRRGARPEALAEPVDVSRGLGGKESTTAGPPHPAGENPGMPVLFPPRKRGRERRFRTTCGLQRGLGDAEGGA